MNRVLNLLLLILILTTPDLAPAQALPSRQSEPGTIRGTVLDPHGAVIPEAEVRATNNRTGEPIPD